MATFGAVRGDGAPTPPVRGDLTPDAETTWREEVEVFGSMVECEDDVPTPPFHGYSTFSATPAWRPNQARTLVAGTGCEDNVKTRDRCQANKVVRMVQVLDAGAGGATPDAMPMRRVEAEVATPSVECGGDAPTPSFRGDWTPDATPAWRLNEARAETEAAGTEREDDVRTPVQCQADKVARMVRALDVGGAAHARDARSCVALHWVRACFDSNPAMRTRCASPASDAEGACELK